MEEFYDASINHEMESYSLKKSSRETIRNRPPCGREKKTTDVRVPSHSLHSTDSLKRLSVRANAYRTMILERVGCTAFEQHYIGPFESKDRRSARVRRVVKTWTVKTVALRNALRALEKEKHAAGKE